MNNKEVLSLVQLIISADVILNKYSKLTIKQKTNLIKQIEKLKELEK